MPARLFPHETVRQGQDDLITGVLEAIDTGGQLVVHAPTGLGKTAAALAPAIERAIDTGKIVVFLTSRLTQHRLALETVDRIAKRHNIAIPVVDLIGKRHMCLQPGVENLGGKEFAEYCKSLREDGACTFYERLRTGEQHSAQTRSALIQLGTSSPNTPEQVKVLCSHEELQLCPYEITMLLAKDARVIITDYSYIFNASIREGFFRRINRELKDCILIIDEAHNLPDRVKDLATEQLTVSSLRRAIREVEKFSSGEHKDHLQQIGEILQELGNGVKDERYVGREEFFDRVRHVYPPDTLIADLDKVATIVREEQRSASCGTVAQFLRAWQGDDDGFTRIISTVDGPMASEEPTEQQTLHPIFGQKIAAPSSLVKFSRNLQLSYRCLDPSVLTKPVLDAAQSAILMSGTLTPPQMYAQLLGASSPKLLTLNSPFPSHNRLNIIVPKTTTKFTSRSPGMYASIAQICNGVLQSIPGNCAVFFPSYQILSEVRSAIEHSVAKTVFVEHHSFTREEREELLERFKSYQATGAVLLGVMGGSFSEGIDLPGNALRGVIVVGLPLGRPDLETKALIEHYDHKFGKGWDYGYTYPAFNKTLQTAGRCIRTETDRGVIVFIDERYAWPSYFTCFPKEWEMVTTLRYEALIRAFFSEGEHG